MWRTFFLAIGFSLAVFGGEFLLVEKAVWAEAATDSDVQQVAGYLLDRAETENEVKTDFQPDPWAPWAMLSSGAILILYCLSVPKLE
ncbi:MAG: hypothetical protein P8M80_16375 [Pirellulaceae bacterium]|nr:hypothetical protein [Pirellulaceae bacterium]